MSREPRRDHRRFSRQDEFENPWEEREEESDVVEVIEERSDVSSDTSSYPVRRSDKRSMIQARPRATTTKHGPKGESNRLRTKNGRHTRDSSTDTIAFGYLVIHEVRCGNQYSNHRDHKQLKQFRDTARMFKGDSRTRQLRGTDDFKLERYLQDARNHPSFIIMRAYDCEIYHDELEKNSLFRRPEGFNSDPAMPSHIRTWLTSLQNDGPLAESISESMNFMSGDDTGPNIAYLSAPYLGFYHLRSFIRSCLEETLLEPGHEEQITAFIDYLTITHGPGYNEADELFKNGMVSRRHFTKLFRPGEVVVNHDQAEVVAYVSLLCPTSETLPLDLDCVFWDYDGHFHKEYVNLRVRWPAENDTDVIKITDLSTFPLRFDTSNLEDKLRKRGKMFWKCRHAQFVSYSGPKSAFDLQTVGCIIMFLQ